MKAFEWTHGYCRTKYVVFAKTERAAMEKILSIFGGKELARTEFFKYPPKEIDIVGFIERGAESNYLELSK